MKNYFNIVLVATFCLFFAQFIVAQDFTFSQFQAMPYLLNPAATGHIPSHRSKTGNKASTFQHRIALLSRSQWETPATPNSLWGSAAGFDGQICTNSRSFFFGYGAYLQYNQSRPGNFHHLNARAAFSAAHQLWGDNWISGGFSGGLLQYGINPEQLTFDEQYNTKSGNFDLKRMFNGEGNSMIDQWTHNVYDMDMGLRVFNSEKNAAFGMTLHHVTQPRYSFIRGSRSSINRLNMGISLQGTYAWQVLDGRCSINIFGIFRRQAFNDNRQWQSLAGASFRFKRHFEIGVSGRLAGRYAGVLVGDAIIPFAGFRWHQILIRGSWDVSLARKGVSPGGPEMSLVFFLRENRTCVHCPEW